jgi:hypothetical protein
MDIYRYDGRPLIRAPHLHRIDCLNVSQKQRNT